VGRRRLHSTCLDFLMSSVDGFRVAAKLAKRQFDSANCMTDKLSSLACLVGCSGRVGSSEIGEDRFISRDKE